MSKKRYKLWRQIPWFTMGVLGLQISGGVTSVGESLLPKVAAFTSPVSNQEVWDETLKGGDTQEVYSGGITNRTTVTGDGDLSLPANQNVYDGGVANDTEVNDWGTQVIYSGGIANDTVVNGSSGRQVVYAGGVTHGTSVNGSLGQFVYGGIAHDTVVNNGGLQVVQDGGASNNTILYKASLQEVRNATSNNTKVNDTASQVIWKDGVANNTILNDSGNQSLYDGGIANGTQVNDQGWQYLYEGIAYDTTLNDQSSQVIDMDGSVERTVLNDEATQQINGGTASYTTLNKNSVQDVTRDGTANHTTLNDNSIQNVTNGGTANDSLVNTGSKMILYYGGTAAGTANDTIVDGGEMIIMGSTANDTTVKKGLMLISDNSMANRTEVNGSGLQEVHAGGVANDTTISGGGVQALFGVSDYGTSRSNNTTATAGGTILVMENGTYLTGNTILDGGALRINPASTDGSAFVTANIENLSGNGQIYLNTNLQELTGDLVLISGTTAGNHQVFANNQGGATVDPTETLTVIETEGGGNFTIGHQLEVGGYLYGLRQNPGTTNNWELYSTGKYTPAANASINAFVGGYLLNYAETQTLLQRMGDLRQSEGEQGAWAKVSGGKFDSNGSSFLSGFDMTYSGVQVGVDRKVSLKNGKGDWYVGGMFGYSKGNLDYATGRGSIDSKTLGAYGTYIAPNGAYADLVLKYGWMKNDFKVLDTAGDRVTGDDMNTNGLSASIEVGKKIHFNKEQKQGWYVEPQAQLSMGHQSGGSFNASNGLRVDVDSYNSVLGRVGANIGYEVKGGKNPVNVYGKVSLVHEFNGDIGFRMNGISNQESFGDSWWTYGVGVTAQLNQKHNVYLDIERASGGQFRQPWSVNVGYRFTW